MKNRFVLIIIFAICLAGIACSAANQSVRAESAVVEKLVWPLPPDQPRISLENTISSSEDIGGKKNAGAKIIGAIFGKDAPKRIVMPYSVCSDGNGKLFITDTGLAAFHVFDTRKRRHTIVSEIGKEPMESPVGIAVGNNRIYVSDAGKGLVHILDGKFKEADTFGRNIFSRPTALFYDNNGGRLLVCDTVAHKIFICDAKGNVVKEIGGRGDGDGEFNFPNSVCADKDGRIYVLDSLNYRVQTFTKDGEFISRFGMQGNGPGAFACPKGIAVDRHDHIFVVDSIFGNFQVFDKTGQILLVVGQRGTKQGEFYLPSGIFVDSSDNIYLADTYNHRIQVLKYLSED